MKYTEELEMCKSSHLFIDFSYCNCYSSGIGNWVRIQNGHLYSGLNIFN